MKSQLDMLHLYMEHILRFLSRLKVQELRRGDLLTTHMCTFKVVVGKLWRHIRGQRNTMSASKFYLHLMTWYTSTKTKEVLIQKPKSHDKILLWAASCMAFLPNLLTLHQVCSIYWCHNQIMFYTCTVSLRLHLCPYKVLTSNMYIHVHGPVGVVAKQTIPYLLQLKKQLRSGLTSYSNDRHATTN